MDARKKEVLEARLQQVYDLADKYEATIGGCPQATMAALMSVLDLPKDLFRALGPMQGGVGQYHGDGPCGAYTAGVCIMGYYRGRSWEEFFSGGNNAESVRLARKFDEKWRETYKNISCRGLNLELFGRTFNNYENEEDYKEFIRMGGYVDKCNKICANSAKIILEILIGEEII